MNTGTVEIARTIANQIKSLDQMAFFAWGCRKRMIALDVQGKPTLRFTATNNPNIKTTKECTVDVSLNGKDLYDIRVYKSRYTYKNGFQEFSHYEEFGLREDVYCDELVSAIDGILG